MPNLSRRATEPELLDAGVSDEEALRSLADLRSVNRFLGGRRALLRAVQPLFAGLSRPSLLDVGCGSAELPALLRAQLDGRLLAVGLDLKLLHVRQTPQGVQAVVADARALPFRPAAFDVVSASLFLHHFDEPELPDVLRGLWSVARRALVVNDLRRAHVPYVFARLVFPHVMRTRVSVCDGLLSIRRAFRPDELRRAFAQAGIESVTVRRSFPYRLVAVARRA